MYGKELILDLHKCSLPFTRKNIRNYFKEVCNLIDMERCKLCWWDDLYSTEKEKETEPHLMGTSAVQFIKTSNITIHTLDKLHNVYLNIFSCKNFNVNVVTRFTAKWFRGEVVGMEVIKRK